ncbi:conserved protein of unknown function [Thauera humireducens]|nr:conserved protein of unknown function [Thauera humireducens]
MHADEEQADAAQKGGNQLESSGDGRFQGVLRRGEGWPKRNTASRFVEAHKIVHDKILTVGLG